MRVVYLGTSEFAAAVLRALCGGDHRPVLAVTPPDRRRGRGRRPAAAPVAAAAESLGIDVLRTESASGAEALERIRGRDPEIGVVCAFGQILRDPLLSELELLNVHPSLLPRWRGAAPIERAIMAGDELTGVSIMRVTEGLDSGPVAMSEDTAIGDADYGELSSRLADLGARLLIRTLDLRARGPLELTPQEDSAATYAEKISAADRVLDPALSAIELERRVRALSPHVGAYLPLAGGDRLGVLAARAEDGELAPGAVAADGRLLLGCSAGVLRLLRVRPAGARAMDAEAYLRGHEPPQPA